MSCITWENSTGGLSARCSLSHPTLRSAGSIWQGGGRAGGSPAGGSLALRRAGVALSPAHPGRRRRRRGQRWWSQSWGCLRSPAPTCTAGAPRLSRPPPPRPHEEPQPLRSVFAGLPFRKGPWFTFTKNANCRVIWRDEHLQMMPSVSSKWISCRCCSVHWRWRRFLLSSAALSAQTRREELAGVRLCLSRRPVALAHIYVSSKGRVQLASWVRVSWVPGP